MSETETRDDAEREADAEFALSEIARLRRAARRYRVERDAAEAELSRLRGVVEAVQALADEWERRAGDHAARPKSRIDMHEAVDLLRAALAPVSSSGEAESGVEAVLRVAADYVSDMEAPHPEDFCQKCGGRNVELWFAPSPVWNAIVGDEWSIICPQCFVELAEATEEYAQEAWELRPTIRYPVASVGSSGEAESGEGDFRDLCDACSGHEKPLRFSPKRGAHFCPACFDRENHRPAPVPSGRQADEAAVDAILTEHFGHTVYEPTGDQPEECHDECPACLAGEQITALLAARPVLSREAPLLDALRFVVDFIGSAGNGEGWTLDHVDAVARVAGVYSNVTDHDRELARSVMGDAWLTDVLTAGGEQA